MDDLNKLRLLAGVPVQASSATKQRVQETEQLDESIGHPVTAGGKYRFYLVKGANSASDIGDVISEVDVRALCDMARGGNAKSPHQEQWELFPVDGKREAMKLAKARLEKAQREHVAEAVVAENHFKKGSTVTNDDKEYEVVDINDAGTDDEEYVVKCPTSGKEKTFKPEDLKQPKTKASDLQKQTQMNEKDSGCTCDDNEKEEEEEERPTAAADRGREKYNSDAARLQPLLQKYRKEGRSALTDDEYAQLKVAFDSAKAAAQKAKTGNTAMSESMMTFVDMFKSFEPHETDPVNVTDGSSNKDKVFDDPRSSDTDESPTQLRQPASDQTIKVPTSITKTLKDQAKEAREEAKKVESRDTDTASFYLTLAQAFEDLCGHLEGGTVYDIKKAQIFMTSLMGPILHKIPAEVVRFVSYGGQPRSLKSFMKKV